MDEEPDNTAVVGNDRSLYQTAVKIFMRTAEAKLISMENFNSSFSW